MKKLCKWMDSKVKKLGWLDVKLIKWSVFAFTLMLAKLWPPLLSLEWYWYGLLFVVFAIKPMMVYFRK